MAANNRSDDRLFPGLFRLIFSNYNKGAYQHGERDDMTIVSLGLLIESDPLCRFCSFYDVTATIYMFLWK